MNIETLISFTVVTILIRSDFLQNATTNLLNYFIII